MIERTNPLRTIRQTDSPYNGSAQNAVTEKNKTLEGESCESEIPRNYVYDLEGNLNIDSSGTFQIKDMALNVDYRLKFRSKIYVNYDMPDVILGLTTSSGRLPMVVLVSRPKA